MPYYNHFSDKNSKTSVTLGVVPNKHSICTEPETFVYLLKLFIITFTIPFFFRYFIRSMELVSSGVVGNGIW